MDRDYIWETHMVLDVDKPIGNFSLMIDPGHLYKKIPMSAWLGITIGERDYWGSGAASFALKKFEERANELKCSRIELGVFEFNERAIRFYLKNGYKEIGRINDFAWDGKRQFDDIRMEKIL